MEIRRQVDNLMREELDLLKAVSKHLARHYHGLEFVGCGERQGEEGKDQQKEKEGKEGEQEGEEKEGQRPDSRQDDGVSV